MKILVKYSLIFILSYSCINDKQNNIIGKWNFNGIEAIEGKEISEETNKTLMLMLLLINTIDTSDNSIVIDFKDNNTYHVLKPNGEIYEQGSYKIAGDKLLMINEADSESDEYEILKNDVDTLCLVSNNEFIVKYSRLDSN